MGTVDLLLALGQANLLVKAVQIAAAGALCGFGLYQLLRSRVGIRVGFRDLNLRSYLIASTDGAGLMFLPLPLRADAASVPLHQHHNEGWTLQALEKS